MSLVKKALDTVLRGAGVIFIALIGRGVYSVKNPKDARIRNRELKHITFEDEDSALRAVKRLRDIARIRKTASFYDLCETLNFESEYRYGDGLWGWTLSDLKGVRAYRDGDIWRINLPKVSRLVRPARHRS